MTPGGHVCSGGPIDLHRQSEIDGWSASRRNKTERSDLGRQTLVYRVSECVTTVGESSQGQSAGELNGDPTGPLVGTHV
jgi:hypothetical protein